MFKRLKKEIPRQLQLNTNVEACFYKHEGMISTMLRISGKAEFVHEEAHFWNMENNLKPKLLIEF